MTTEETHERFVLLNNLISRSATQAPQEYRPPTHGAKELLDLLEGRKIQGSAVEFFGASAQLEADDETVEEGAGRSLLRLRDSHSEDLSTGGSVRTLLFEYVDESVRSFPVVNRRTFSGRELSGESEERGAVTAHVAVLLPGAEAYDDGTYRCIVEAVPTISRKIISVFFRRQLKKETVEWTFTIEKLRKGGKATAKEYKYSPRLELQANAARSLGELASGRTFTSFIFTKKKEKHNAGQPSDVDHKDFVADVEARVSAKQAPADPAEKKSWFSAIRSYYESRGYETRLMYRSSRGAVVTAGVQPQMDSAIDLVLCPREQLSLSSPPRRWRDTICPEIRGKMRELLARDELWQRLK